MNPAQVFWRWRAVVKHALAPQNRPARTCPRFPANRVHLCVERLECRDAPAALTFTGATNNNWGVANNWDDLNGNHSVPTANDTATIPAGKVCTVDVAGIAKSVDVATTADLTVQNLGGFGLLVDDGLWNSGRLFIFGVVFGTVANSGTCTITNPGRVTGHVTNSGDVTINGGTISGLLSNAVGGTALVTADGTVGTLSNGGTLTFAGVFASLTVTGDLTTTGTIAVNASGPNINRVAVGGTANLGGTLDVSLVFGAANRQQQYFPVTWGARNGVFGFAGPYVLGAYRFSPTYQPGALRVAVPPIQIAWWPEHLPRFVGIASGGPYAEFFDDAPGLTASDYSVTINWGAGPETGWVWQFPDEPEHYFIGGPSHVYDSEGWYTVTISLTDNISNVTWVFQYTFFVSWY